MRLVQQPVEEVVEEPDGDGLVASRGISPDELAKPTRVESLEGRLQEASADLLVPMLLDTVEQQGGSLTIVLGHEGGLVELLQRFDVVVCRVFVAAKSTASSLISLSQPSSSDALSSL